MENYTNYPIDAALEAAEDTITINVSNMISGTTVKDVSVYSTNTLSQILEAHYLDLGININAKVQYKNKRTGRATSDGTETVQGIGLMDGDVLSVSDDSIVAGEEEIISIDLVNKISGTTCAQVAVYGSNTLAQVLKAYAGDIGIVANDRKIIFENKRTGEATSDLEQTIDGLGLVDGDVLAIADNAGVAGNRESFPISLENRLTGVVIAPVEVYAENVLKQVLHEYGADMGIDPWDKWVRFENKRTGVLTRNKYATIDDLGLEPDDILVLAGGVC